MPQLETQTLNEVNEIQLSEGFYKRSHEDQIKYLIKLASSSNHALDLMQKERNQLLSEAVLLKQQLQNAESAYQIQKNIVAQVVQESNTDQQGVAQEIIDLRLRVRQQDEYIEAIKNGNIN